MNTFTYTDRPSEGIVNIPITLLRHHPDNPRKDLGDLSELAASIKAKGVMQNLTVVPFRDEGGTGCYYVVIGNRRMEASKQAGLETLPCVISDMTVAEQVQTMLLENMQRVNLTVYEQAAGFQMMMDFGDSVKQISEKTGFSENTVRHRLKMAELDMPTLKKVSDRQLSLGDFDKLAEIEDLEERNKVLEHIGTANFLWNLTKAKERQTERERCEKWRAALTAAGFTELTRDEGWNGPYSSLNGEWGSQLRLDTKNVDDFKPETYEANERFFFFDYTRWLYFRQPKVEEPEDAIDEEEERLEQERVERKAKLNDACKLALAMRTDYVKNMAESEAKRHFSKAIAVITTCNHYQNHYRDAENLFDKTDDALKQAVADAPYRTILWMAFVSKNGDYLYTSHDYDGHFTRNDYMTAIYDFLVSIGYEPSDEESALVDGTSDLYLREESNG